MIMDFYNQSHQLGYEYEKEKKIGKSNANQHIGLIICVMWWVY